MWRKELSTLCTVGGNADWCSHSGKQDGNFLKKLKMELPYDPVIPLLGIYLKKPKTLTQKGKCSPMFFAVKLQKPSHGSNPTAINRQTGTFTQWNTTQL